jgi:drug/metabolite transporter (DMT)-like permease
VLIDVGKLIFGSIFLGGILRGEIPQAILAIGGLVIAIALLAAGILLVTKREKDEENGSPPAKKE